ncbi:hypothetical protein TNCV_4820691 [Trichonephila clavipes]|nr:hypothetical protein TNCV_4820691 [Trichonephila clavipes]
MPPQTTTLNHRPFCDVTEVKQYSDLSTNQLALRISSGIETTLIHNWTTPLMRCPVFVLLTPSLNGATDG